MNTAVRSICDRSEAPATLTVVVTNGETMAAAHGGKDLFLSTYKTRCSDRHVCKSLSPECEAPTTSGRVNHCIVSSEPLQGENVWMPLKQGDIVSVDARMHVVQTSTERTSLPMALGA
jgi:glutamine amidotransferase